MAKVVKAAVVVAAVATGVGMIAGLTAGATFAVGGLALSGATAYFATSFVTNLVLGGLSKALSKSSSSGGASITMQDRTVTTRQPISPTTVIYGRTRVGGTILYMESTDSNKYLHMIIAVSGHEIDGFEKIYFNEDEVPLDANGNASSGQYAGKARLLFKTGTDDQSAFSELVSASAGKWTSEHRVRGRALIYARLEFDQAVYYNGIPNISALVRGKKVYDPRSDTTVWSANPALCVADYITNSSFGLAADYENEINESALIAAANICDEDVAKVGGGVENRYECHGNFVTSSKPEDVINQLVASMAGKCIWSGGVWRIVAGAYYTPTLNFDENDLIGGFRLQTLVSRRESFNGVKGVFLSPENKYIISDFPAVTSATYVAQDNGEENIKSIELPWTTSVSMAQRLAKIELLRARQQITVSMPMRLAALKANVGDVITISNTRLGWSSKAFEVTSAQLTFGEVLGVDLELREVASNVYDWSTDEESPYDAAPNTNLPSVTSVTAPKITVSDEIDLVLETVVTNLIVEVEGADVFQDRYEVQIKLSTESSWFNLGQGSGNIFKFSGAVDGQTYNVRARVINILGIASSWTQKSYQVVGKLYPPQDVTGFALNIVGDTAHLSWNPVTDVDLSHYRIRHSTNDPATYSNGIDLIEKVPRPGVFAIVPAMTGTYFIKAVDKVGMESSNASSTAAIIESVKNLNFIVSLDEDPSFSGTKTNCVAIDNALLLDTSLDFDDLEDNFDDTLGLFDGGNASVASSGEYEFSDYVDLGGVYTSRVTGGLNYIRIDYANLFDDQQGEFDSFVGLFDGNPDTYGDTNVEYYVATTDDDPYGTPTWSDWRKFFVGDYKARGYKFKAILYSKSNIATPKLSKLFVSIDMPDRVISGSSISTGASSKSVTFNKQFKNIPAIAITAEDLTNGDYYEITSKTSSGFTITFKNSSGVAVDRTFDYVAKGYGELAA